MLKFAKPNSGPSKVDIAMAPMIDIVFQLLIFFMLNLKIIAPEGTFNINMPIGAPIIEPSETVETPEIKVRLMADANGDLTDLMLGENSLGNGLAAFEKLNTEILKLIGRPGQALAKDIEIEIDADYDLRYEYIIRAVSKCTGRMDAHGNVIRYVEKIKFAPPRKN